jgi:hypothetical protein
MRRMSRHWAEKNWISSPAKVLVKTASYPVQQISALEVVGADTAPFLEFQ